MSADFFPPYIKHRTSKEDALKYSSYFFIAKKDLTFFSIRTITNEENLNESSQPVFCGEVGRWGWASNSSSTNIIFDNIRHLLIFSFTKCQSDFHFFFSNFNELRPKYLLQLYS